MQFSGKFQNNRLVPPLGNPRSAIELLYIYRLQRSWAKVIFLQACVCSQGEGCLSMGGRCLPQCMLGYPPPPEADIHPPRPGTPQTRHPQTRHHPRTRHPPRPEPPEVDTPLRSRPPRPGTPQDQAPPQTRHPPGPGPPWTRPLQRQTPPRSRHLPDQAPSLDQAPPQTRPPSPEADCNIRSTSGRYASYWNAFLYHEVMIYFCTIVVLLTVSLVIERRVSDVFEGNILATLR